MVLFKIQPKTLYENTFYRTMITKLTFVGMDLVSYTRLSYSNKVKLVAG